MHRINLQPSAHIQEVGHSPGLQHSVDSHPAPWRGIQQVLEDLQVCQEVHGYGHHLGKRRKGGGIQMQPIRGTAAAAVECTWEILMEYSLFCLDLNYS